MREDELATAVVEHFGVAFDDATVRLEEPYDHYGNRGVVDAHVRVRGAAPVDYLVELKSDAALGHVTGANEVLRQYRRMERYFYKDEEHSLRTSIARDGPGVHVMLLFAPTSRCVEHVWEHRRLYGSVDQRGTVGGASAARKVAFLTNLDAAAEGGLGFLSVNGEVDVGSEEFAGLVPPDSRLASALGASDRTWPGRAGSAAD
ncbi:hypothetical protein [Halorarum salinum]|uniref:Uncharacterized protein n=1 Tax=Halorarum salinum TaxID=2743089 RepID=A0A7D5QAU0_9EURY|nr:hypothetical protein [Halobaculum salinum]QLG62677.1 hypothetical protein HUG12_13450 [Halobaculum salinum]